MATPKRGVPLTKSTLKNVNYQFLGAFRLRVDAGTPTGGMDSNVFLYRRDPYDIMTGETIDTYLNTASAVDMAEYPVGDPNPETNFPFFRLSWFEIDIRASSIAEKLWQITVAEVNNLCAALDRLELLVPIETVQCGAASTSGNSDSVSTSTSY
jgi:hypothetical protein